MSIFFSLILVVIRTNFTHDIELYNNTNLRTETMNKQRPKNKKKYLQEGLKNANKAR